MQHKKQDPIKAAIDLVEATFKQAEFEESIVRIQAEMMAAAAVNQVLRGHELFPDSIKAQMKPFYWHSDQSLGFDAIYPTVKFFGGGWTWYAYEFDAPTQSFFGLVSGFEVEYGAFSLLELEAASYPMRLLGKKVLLPIERDLYFHGGRESMEQLYRRHSRR